MLPDGTYPNAVICKELMLTLQQLQLGSLPDHLSDSNLMSLIGQYASGNTGHGKEIQHLAKSLKDKWHREMYNVEVDY